MDKGLGNQKLPRKNQVRCAAACCVCCSSHSRRPGGVGPRGGGRLVQGRRSYCTLRGVEAGAARRPKGAALLRGAEIVCGPERPCRGAAPCGGGGGRRSRRRRGLCATASPPSSSPPRLQDRVEREKAKREKDQSSVHGWKSEAEMAMRQTYD